MTRHHDLPPRWDGLPVEWDDRWILPDSQPIMCHIDDGPRGSEPAFGPEFCDRCGRIARHPTRQGIVSRDIGTDLPLIVDRCHHCGHDRVTGIEQSKTNRLALGPPRSWDLDLEDYADTGSYERVV